MQQGAATAAAAQMAGAAVSGSKTKKGERQVHEERWKMAAQSAANFSASGSSSVSAGTRVLTELTLETPIRYFSFLDSTARKKIHNNLYKKQDYLFSTIIV
jgi:N-acetyltransferase 10